MLRPQPDDCPRRTIKLVTIESHPHLMQQLVDALLDPVLAIRLVVARLAVETAGSSSPREGNVNVVHLSIAKVSKYTEYRELHAAIRYLREGAEVWQAVDEVHEVLDVVGDVLRVGVHLLQLLLVQGDHLCVTKQVTHNRHIMEASHGTEQQRVGPAV